MQLYTNSNLNKDFVGKRLERIFQNTNVSIATAFFNEAELVLKAVNHGCTVRLVVRLDDGTDPYALSRIMGNTHIAIRYYTSRRFHPKLYIIDNVSAILGSSNMTHSGVGQNQELNVEFEDEHPFFEILKDQFSIYWDDAEVLTSEVLTKYIEIYEANKSKLCILSSLIMRELGEVQPKNIDTGEIRERSQEFISSFRRSYQLYIANFNRLGGIYESVGGDRKYPEVPLRIEVDRFLWWVKESQFIGDAHLSQPIRNDIDIEAILRILKPQYVSEHNDYLDSVVKNYLHVSLLFSSVNRINSMNAEQIYEGLLYIHAFNDRFRFFEGGHPTMKRVFLEKNSEQMIKKSINHILFGNGAYENRIFDAIHTPEYKLEEFGESCVKELFGMINNNEVPICNGRTLKSMQWLGFGHLG